MIAAAVGVAGAIAQQGAAEDAVRAGNRAKLKNHERNNWNYLSKVTLDNARWKNDVSIADVKFDQAYQNMVDPWSQEDAQLDKIFAKHDFRVEKSIRKMYKNDYAGTQTGNTAARLAGKSAREMGYEQAESLNELMFSEEEVEIRKDVHHREAEYKQWEVYDKIRFAPIHGHAPPPPLLDAMPSRAGMFLNIIGSAFGAATGSDAAPSIQAKPGQYIGSTSSFLPPQGYQPISSFP